jgi:predicted membrane chloride channel (bestrophin family)
VIDDTSRREGNHQSWEISFDLENSTGISRDDLSLAPRISHRIIIIIIIIIIISSSALRRDLSPLQSLYTMIRYKTDLFGLRTLCMWNGSAAFRAVTPALVSTGLLVAYWQYWKTELERVVENTATISVLMGFFGFLLTTRLNFAYLRWWEAATMSHRMTSKLTDSALCLAAFHYQSDHVAFAFAFAFGQTNNVKPETFGAMYAATSIIGGDGGDGTDTDTDDDDGHDDEGENNEDDNVLDSEHPANGTDQEQEKDVVLLLPPSSVHQVRVLTTSTVPTTGDAAGTSTSTSTSTRTRTRTAGGDDATGQGGGFFFRWFQQTVLDAIISIVAPAPAPSANQSPASASASAEPETTTEPSSSNNHANNNKIESKRTITSSRKPYRRATSEPILLVTKSFQPNQKQGRTTTTTTSTNGTKQSVLLFASQQAIPMISPSTATTSTTTATTTTTDFLEEAVHLYSLLNAVAMASLRHDVEGCPSPLAEYIPNRPFPPYNSDYIRDEHGHLLSFPTKQTNNEEEEEENDTTTTTTTSKSSSSPLKHWWHLKADTLWKIIYFLAGIDRSPKQRTLYNAARPFHVLGGVSEGEARRLQLARGPLAQVALCQLWLKECVARESFNGSTGRVAPPIVGRVFHFLTDAMAAYHQCRKIAFIPFPFPHEQMTSLFVVLVIFSFPILYVAFVTSLPFACILNFTTMLCFQGIYEVARELSNPYHTVPNDLPLNRFHAQFNESLRVLGTGFHPDWKAAPTTTKTTTTATKQAKKKQNEESS